MPSLVLHHARDLVPLRKSHPRVKTVDRENRNYLFRLLYFTMYIFTLHSYLAGGPRGPSPDYDDSLHSLWRLDTLLPFRGTKALPSPD